MSLFQIDGLCYRNVFFKILASGYCILIVYHQFGKRKVSVVVGLGVVGNHFYQSGLAAQIDGSSSIFDCRIPVEMWTYQSVILRVVSKCLQLGVIDRQSVLCCYPQSSVAVFNNTFHSVVYQTMLLGKNLKPLFSFVINNALVESVTVTSQP